MRIEGTRETHRGSDTASAGEIPSSVAKQKLAVERVNRRGGAIHRRRVTPLKIITLRDRREVEALLEGQLFIQRIGWGDYLQFASTQRWGNLDDVNRNRLIGRREGPAISCHHHDISFAAAVSGEGIGIDRGVAALDFR